VETWICSKENESKKQATGMIFLRAIMGKTKRDDQKFAHQRRAKDGGYREPNQEKWSEMVWTSQKNG
jgi:hypothetical protein